jgi:predicted dithiol-disulfide oxidoreductase (DUF899 family)
MEQHRIVSREEWLAARKAHLVSEKELTKLHDRVSAERRALPWVKVDKGCVFDGPDGRETLAELFGVNSQLIVYHFISRPAGRRAATAAGSWPTTSTARTSILSITT